MDIEILALVSKLSDTVLEKVDMPILNEETIPDELGCTKINEVSVDNKLSEGTVVVGVLKLTVKPLSLRPLLSVLKSLVNSPDPLTVNKLSVEIMLGVGLE